MYIPASFEVNDDAQVDAFLRRYAFATIVSSPAGGLVATHVPVVAKRTSTGLTLVGHLARANSHWSAMNGAGESLAIFTGPHSYISPTWYASSSSVPTWNYAAVHAYGKPQAIHDRDFTLGHLRELVLRYEKGADGWRMDDQDPKFLERLLSAIVAFQMPVDRVETKFKLGQNRSKEDRVGTIAGLQGESTPEAAALAVFTQSYLGDG